MNTEERRKVLALLAGGRITTAEAEDLLDAGSETNVRSGSSAVTDRAAPKFFRVVVEGEAADAGKVNVRIPMNLLRAGVRIAALLPSAVHDQVNSALRGNGLEFDISKIRPENLEELVEHLAEFTVDVEGNRGERVRVFCE